MRRNGKAVVLALFMVVVLMIMTGVQPAYAAKKKSNGTAVLDEVTRQTMIVDAFNIMNAERLAAGLPLLVWSEDLYASANLRVIELPILYSHTRPDGTSCFTAFPLMRTRGENILMGSSSTAKTAAGAINTWMNSPGHRATILNPEYTVCAMSLVQSGKHYYWIQCFGGY